MRRPFDRYSIFEFQALNSEIIPEGIFKAIPVKIQKEFFGYAPFGRRKIRIDPLSGEIEMVWSICYGQDFEHITSTPERMALTLNSKSRMGRK